MRRRFSFPLLFTAVCASACARPSGPAPSDALRMDSILNPVQVAQALQRAGGARVKTTLRMAAGPSGEPLDAVTTTTELMLDSSGQYRMAETNDRDGGRDVVLHGHQLYVALRYGKMIRRRAEGSEPAKLLHEGLGAPWSVWDLVRGAAALTSAQENGGTVWKMRLADQPGAVARAGAGPTAMWRDAAVIDSLDGAVTLDGSSGALRRADLRAAFHAVRQGGQPLRGELEVHATVEPLASTDRVSPPADPQDLVTRQRTLPEEKALLGGPTAAERARQDGAGGGSGLPSPSPTRAGNQNARPAQGKAVQEVKP